MAKVNGRRDPNSHAFVNTDTGAFAKAKVRKQRAKEIEQKEQELVYLKGQVEHLTKMVEVLLKERHD